MVHTSKQPLLRHVCKCCVWNTLDFSLHYLSFDNFRQDLRCLYIYRLKYVYVLFGFSQTNLHFAMNVFESWSFFNMMFVMFYLTSCRKHELWWSVSDQLVLFVPILLFNLLEPSESYCLFTDTLFMNLTFLHTFNLVWHLNKAGNKPLSLRVMLWDQ